MRWAEEMRKGLASEEKVEGMEFTQQIAFFSSTKKSSPLADHGISGFLAVMVTPEKQLEVLGNFETSRSSYKGYGVPYMLPHDPKYLIPSSCFHVDLATQARLSCIVGAQHNTSNRAAFQDKKVMLLSGRAHLLSGDIMADRARASPHQSRREVAQNIKLAMQRKDQVPAKGPPFDISVCSVGPDDGVDRVDWFPMPSFLVRKLKSSTLGADIAPNIIK
ncbi:hypothetical protein SODALDRAFT_360054 [Sodiomyces alkalinus F11]|uniref:Uncharacterized protein n=1 Tax=Sodiomyces alkalinus (strain CBS 110278 / VKM F-3762 / F11) TaxID=1314773 RepID=A0A3N2PTK1_SODAK|nr:hypothetical protein SODALDRAFT_360054 [Sodiomyces alkalinus F11]ROT37764.1 hypothetical protein SODALDRAFT_360054 [Sodiomyces alkalinus F11]